MLKNFNFVRKKNLFFLHLLNTILKFAIILINFNQNNVEYEKDF